jgi:hypothetical protein
LGPTEFLPSWEAANAAPRRGTGISSRSRSHR